jgi:hypothetical protein
MSTTGVKGTKELLTAANTLTVEIIKLLKDGAQAADVTVFLNDIMNDKDGLKTALVAAYNDVKGIPTELKAMDWTDGVELANIQLQFIPQIVGAFKA